MRLAACLALVSAVAHAAPPVVPPASAAPVTPQAVPAVFVVEGGRVVAVQGEARTVLSLPEGVLGILHDGSSLHVARGPAGAALYDVTDPSNPQLVTTVATAGTATGFHRVDGQVWIVVVQRSAVPFEGGGPAPAVAVAAPAPGSVAAAPRPVGGQRAVARAPEPIEILRVTTDSAVLSAGSDRGLRIGDVLEVYRARRVVEEGTEGFTGEDRVGTLEITAVKDATALGAPGRGTIVRGGDRARRMKDRPGHSFPPRMTDVGEAALVLRPIVNAGRPLGVGVLADLEASYWTDSYFGGVRLHPIGIGWTDSGSIVATAALAEGGYEGHALSVGLGAGLSWVNGDLDHMLQRFGSSDSGGSAADGGPTREEKQETHTAFTLSQMARLGARDGLNLWIHNLLLLHEDEETAESGFIYGGTTARLSAPLDSRSDFFLEGGGGLMGYWFVGLGMSTWLKGNGAPGSYRLSVSAGAAGIRGSTEVTETYSGSSYTYDDEVDIAGPMVSLGLARRFGF